MKKNECMDILRDVAADLYAHGIRCEDRANAHADTTLGLVYHAESEVWYAAASAVRRRSVEAGEDI